MRKGVYRGRPPKIDIVAIQARLDAGISPTEVAREMGVSRGTIYNAKAQMATGSDVTEGHDHEKELSCKRPPVPPKLPVQAKARCRRCAI